MNAEEKITLIKKLADCLASLPVTQIPATDVGIINFVNHNLYGIIKGIEKDDTFLSLFHNIALSSIYEIKGRLSASFIVIRLYAEHSFLIAGPCLKEPFSNSLVENIIKKIRISAHAVKRWHSITIIFRFYPLPLCVNSVKLWENACLKHPPSLIIT